MLWKQKKSSNSEIFRRQNTSVKAENDVMQTKLNDKEIRKKRPHSRSRSRSPKRHHN